METTNNQPGGINHITWKTLDEHLNIPELPFAVLLKGPWGVGKTWFVQNFMEANKDKYRSCYVSLFGVTSVSDIKTAVGFGMLKSTGKLGKGAAWATRVFSDLDVALPMVKSSNWLASFLMNRAPTVLFKDVTETFSDDSKKNIFIFDDLDRCTLDINDILGYINDFVIDKKSRVIIVMHENYMQKNLENYVKFKEKIVGLTLSIEPDHIATLEDATNKFLGKNQEIKTIVDKYKSSICDIFVESETKNLRHLGRALVELTRILKHFDGDMLENKEFVENFIKFHCAYSFAIHSNVVAPNEIVSFYYHSYLGKLSDNSKLLLKRHAWLEQLKIGAENFWRNFFTSGAISDDLKTYFCTAYGPKAVPTAPYRLYHFMDMEEQDFNNDLDELNKKIKEKDYKSAEIVLLAFSIKLYLSELKLTNDDPGNILNEALDYIKQTEIEFSSKYELFKSFVTRGSLAGIGIPNSDDPNMQKITKAMIDRSYEEIILKGKKSMYGDLQKNLKDNPADFFTDMESLSKERKISFKIISDSVTAKEVVEALNTFSTQKRMAYFFSLKEIILDSLMPLHSSNSISYYESIMNWTCDLSKELDKLAQSTSSPLQKHQTNMLVSNANDVVDVVKTKLDELKSNRE